MSHEKGIETGIRAAMEVLYDYPDGHTPRSHVIDIVKAYLDASGMVMVPRESTEDMKSRGADAFFSPEPKSISDENRRAASVWRKMIAAAPNPFQTPEENREKK